MVETRSMSTTDNIVTRSMPKTDPVIAEQTEKEKMDELAKTDLKIAEQTEKEKMVAFAKSNQKLPNGEPIPKTKLTIDTEAMILFMENDYLKRYYEKQQRPTTGVIPKEVNRAGQLEWLSFSDREKAACIAMVNNMRADELAKTDSKIAEQTVKEKMVAFAKSNSKLPKNAKIICINSSGEPIQKTKLTIDTEAMILFMENDYLKRYCENHPPSTTGLIPMEVSRAGQLVWRSFSASEKASWIAKVNNMRADELAKTDPNIAEQTEKEKMVAFPKSNWKKNAKIIGKDSSGKPIWMAKWTIETDAMFLFMENDYLKRYYEKQQRPTTGVIPKEVNRAGQLEWLSFSDREKAAWIEKVNNRRDALRARRAGRLI